MIWTVGHKLVKQIQAKYLFYYFLFCLLFVLIHLLLVSIFSFFHFLLDHEMGTIESWISRNSWELISFAKGSSFFLVYKLTKLNDYKEKKFWDYFKELLQRPSKKSIILVLFILGIFYALIVQYGGGIKSNQFLDDVLFSSFFGSLCFFGIDVICLIYLYQFFGHKPESYWVYTFYNLILFILASKIVLPYMTKYLILLVVHFLTLSYLSHQYKLSDILVYLVLIVAPMSSFFGLDLVWDNSFAIVNYNEKIPVIGILSIWLVALTYYRISRLD